MNAAALHPLFSTILCSAAARAEGPWHCRGPGEAL